MTERRGVCVCVWVSERERWQDGNDGENAAFDCEVSVPLWQEYVTFQCRTPSCPERDRERDSPTIAIEHCEAAAGGTCSDLKASYSGQDGVPLTALLLSLEVDGGQFVHAAWHATQFFQTNQCFKRGTGNQHWWRKCICVMEDSGDKAEMTVKGFCFFGEWWEELMGFSVLDNRSVINQAE